MYLPANVHVRRALPRRTIERESTVTIMWCGEEEEEERQEEVEAVVPDGPDAKPDAEPDCLGHL